jgi:hypothetical protein
MRNDTFLFESNVDDCELMTEAGIWQWAKHKLGKLGSLEKGGNIFGSGEKAEKAKEQFADQFENEASKIGNNINRIMKEKLAEADPDQDKSNSKEFPNGPDGEAFKAMLPAAFEAVNEYIDGLETGGEKLVALEALQRWIKYYMDYSLSDVYKHFESMSRRDDVILEHNLLVKEHAKWVQSLLNEDEDLLAGKSETWKGLNSNMLPGILSGLAAVTGIIALAAKIAIAEAGKQGVEIVKEVVSGGDVSWVKDSSLKYVVQSGDGFDRITLGFMKAGHFATPQELFKACGAGDEHAGILAFAKDLGMKSPEKVAQYVEGQMKAGSIDPLNWGGPGTGGGLGDPTGTTAKSFMAANKHPKDLLTIGAFKAVLIPIVKSTVKLGVAGGASAALVAAAPALAGVAAFAAPASLVLGLGAMAIKALRSKGKKSSRASQLQALFDALDEKLRDLKKKIGMGEKEEKALKTVSTPPPAPPPEPETKPGSEEGEENFVSDEDIVSIEDEEEKTPLSQIRADMKKKKLNARLFDAIIKAFDSKGLVRNVAMNEAIKSRDLNVDAAINVIAVDPEVRKLLGAMLKVSPKRLSSDKIINNKSVRRIVAILVKHDFIVAGGGENKKSESKPKKESFSGNDDSVVLVERWQKIAGLI